MKHLIFIGLSLLFSLSMAQSGGISRSKKAIGQTVNTDSLRAVVREAAIEAGSDSVAVGSGRLHQLSRPEQRDMDLYTNRKVHEAPFKKRHLPEMVEIFEEKPAREAKDRQDLKQDVIALEELSMEKKMIVNHLEAGDPALNSYHKYLHGQMEAKAFRQSLRDSKPQQIDSQGKKARRQLGKKVTKIETKEDKLRKSISKNDHFKAHRLPEHMDSKALNEWEEKADYSALHESLKGDELRSFLSQDQTPDLNTKNEAELRKIGGEVIEKEALELMDSLGENTYQRQLTDKQPPNTKRPEVEKYLAKDSKRKSWIPDAAFFEGVVSFSPDFSSFSLSPNVGYQFNNGVSLGLGLTLHHTRDTSAIIRTAVDFKTFAKYEWMEDLFFLQAEYVVMFPKISYVDVSEQAANFETSGFLLGGGVNFKLKKKKLFAVAIMYSFNQKMGVPTYDAPLLVRLGINPF